MMKKEGYPQTSKLISSSGYKLHIIASTGSLIVPLSANFIQAQQGNQMYYAITSLLHRVAFLYGKHIVYSGACTSLALEHRLPIHHLKKELLLKGRKFIDN
jgi:hypothetical protein